MSRALLLTLLLCAMLSAACGESEPTVSADDLYGGSSARDSETLDTMLSSLRPFPYVHTRLVNQLGQEHYLAADRLLTKLDRIVSNAESEARALEGDAIQRAFDTYLGAMRRMLWHYERLLLVLPDPAYDANAVDAVFADLEAAFREVRRADRDFIRRFSDALPADAREEYRDRLRDLWRRLDELAVP